MMIVEGVYTRPYLAEEANRKIGDLPLNVLAGDKVFFEPGTNILINDVTIDSFDFLMRMLPPSMPNISLAGEPPTRNIEIWEASYLTKRLAEVLVCNVPRIDLNSRVIVPMVGCGESTAESLVRCLSDDYGIYLPIIPAKEVREQQVIIVDDVLKTGGTILRELPEGLINNPQTLYAVWAMAALTTESYCFGREYKPLRQLVYNDQQIFAGVVYAGSGLASPGLGLPVNSISTLLKDDEKAQEVIESLSRKYFGDAIYRAVEKVRQESS